MVIRKWCMDFTTLDLTVCITNSTYSTLLLHLSNLFLCCAKFSVVNVSDISTVIKQDPLISLCCQKSLVSSPPDYRLSCPTIWLPSNGSGQWQGGLGITVLVLRLKGSNVSDVSFR